MPEEINPNPVEDLFPGGFTKRDEANALVSICFRHGPIEDLYSGAQADLLENPDQCRITDAEIRTIMIDASEKLCKLMELKDEDRNEYYTMVFQHAVGCTYKWER